MLTGKELLAKVKDLGDVSKSDLVKACGYVSTKKSGGERLNFTAFYEALLEAKGVSLASEASSGVGKGGRKLSYTATVQGNGNLLIGKAYTALLDLKPGDNFEIKMGRKGFRLIPEGES
ncbi:AbrB family transcriptional regulator [Prochlorococcus sp. MIT 1341]|uniref:AbrB family transcriptional regulator n=1 Tax=Prochlorococcus sp. MIT 1341 TaxID=3096221 RepID=UPI002A74FC3B|nr:AbrB family transcriptional regulator [Prochlorococcus sp. MIT 1341]